MSNLVNIFHIGPQKAATTWLYQCLKEHPQVCCADDNEIHYFDIKFNLYSNDEYHNQFSCLNKKTIDFTSSYIRSPLAPKRIYEYNPDAKIILCLRNPIERAFSHYWHEKKKNRFNFEFDEFKKNYDFFTSWIETGFYAQHIERYLEHFPRKQILVQNFDDLEENPEQFVFEALQFINVSSDFNPAVIDSTVNEAGTLWDLPNKVLQKINRLGDRYLSRTWSKYNLQKKIEKLSKQEYERGVPSNIKNDLMQIYLPEINRTEELLDIDLNGWKQ